MRRSSEGAKATGVDITRIRHWVVVHLLGIMILWPLTQPLVKRQQMMIRVIQKMRIIYFVLFAIFERQT